MEWFGVTVVDLWLAAMGLLVVWVIFYWFHEASIGGANEPQAGTAASRAARAEPSGQRRVA